LYDDSIKIFDSGNVDAVVICVPHYLHPEMGISAIKRNIHVLVEKPTGVYLKQLRELNDFTSTRPGVVFGVTLNQRMNQLYRKIKQMID
jgi:predicted dehydrogenase